MNLKNDRNKVAVELEKLESMDRPLEITDHALVRYLQRVKQLDMEGMKRELLSKLPDNVITGEVTMDGVTYILKGNTVVTIVNKKAEVQ